MLFPWCLCWNSLKLICRWEVSRIEVMHKNTMREVPGYFWLPNRGITWRRECQPKTCLLFTTPTQTFQCFTVPCELMFVKWVALVVTCPMVYSSPAASAVPFLIFTPSWPWEKWAFWKLGSSSLGTTALGVRPSGPGERAVLGIEGKETSKQTRQRKGGQGYASYPRQSVSMEGAGGLPQQAAVSPQ